MWIFLFLYFVSFQLILLIDNCREISVACEPMTKDSLVAESGVFKFQCKFQFGVIYSLPRKGKEINSLFILLYSDL